MSPERTKHQQRRNHQGGSLSADIATAIIHQLETRKTLERLIREAQDSGNQRRAGALTLLREIFEAVHTGPAITQLTEKLKEIETSPTKQSKPPLRG